MKAATRTQKSWLIICGIVLLCIFALPLVGTLAYKILAGSLEFGVPLYHSLSGKAYPTNHIYNALLLTDAKRQANHSGTSNHAKFCHPSTDAADCDATSDFRNATAGESFVHVAEDFKQLGSKDAIGTPYVDGTTYHFGLGWEQLSKLKIPNSSFYWFWTPSIDVSIKYNSNTNYEITKATIVDHEPVMP